MKPTRVAAVLALLGIVYTLGGCGRLDGNHGAPKCQVRVISAIGMRQVLLEVAPEFQRASGCEVLTAFDSGGVIPSRLAAGERFDLVVAPRPVLERLAKSAIVAPGSVVDLADAKVGIAVRKGAPRPEIGSVAAFRAAILAAASIAVPDPALGGSSGVHIARVFDKLEIAAKVRDKLVLSSTPGVPGTLPGDLVARGKTDMAIHQLQELLAVPGLDVIGPLPEELQATFTFSAAIAGESESSGPARALLRHLRSGRVLAVITAKGMYPTGRR